MALTFNIAKCVAWAPGLESEQDWHLWQCAQKPIATELNLPPLSVIPAMQRRRLSPFAKVALHCAMQASGELQANVPFVFSSRHGDLHRTTSLIENIAQANALSPTQFGLSVHNAAAGLFSIFSGNRAPLSAIAAGEHSFMMGLLDCVAKLHVNNLSHILYVYCDLQVPDCYRPYVADDQAIGIGILLEAGEGQTIYSLNPSDSSMQASFTKSQAFDFMHFMLSEQNSWSTKINKQDWQLKRSI